MQTPSRQPFALDVGGQRLRLTAQGNEEHLAHLAATVNNRVDALAKTAKGAPPSSLLAMVALDLADEVATLRRALDDAHREASARAADADARVHRAEQLARDAIADALSDIDQALAADDARMTAQTEDGASG